MRKEKLVITMECEDIPNDAQFLDFQVRTMHDGWFTKIFKDWKKIKVHRLVITKLEVAKAPPDTK